MTAPSAAWRRAWPGTLASAAAVVLVLGSWGPASDAVTVQRPGVAPDAETASPPTPATGLPESTAPASPSDEARAEPDRGGPVEIGYRVEVRADGAATADFDAFVEAVLTDARGWVRAGFRFVPDPDSPYRIVLAEGDEVDRLCHPYDTAGRFSCQNGPVVAINADRWRVATPQWPADVVSYRTMLVNHEVGHLLHLHHPDPQCPGAGLPAPVMAQQSGMPGDCLPNPWPLQWEIDLAAERREPLAPTADHDPSDHRPSPPPVDR